MGLLFSGFIRILAGFFHIWSNLYSFSPLTPLPLSLIILSTGVTLGTPVSFALLVRCCGIVFRYRNTGTGSSGRVTQVVRLRDRFPIWRKTSSYCRVRPDRARSFQGSFSATGKMKHAWQLRSTRTWQAILLFLIVNVWVLYGVI